MFLMATLQLTLLGAFQAHWNGRPIIHFRSANTQGLLAYLALEADRAHARDSLATLFWPDQPTATARHNLRQTLYQLRRLLEPADPPFLLITRQTVQFNRSADCDLDVARFLDGLERRNLAVAETLYAGDLLAGFNCDSPLFEAWARRQQERLHRLALTALHELTAQRLQQGGDAYAAALVAARRQLELEPWRETAHRQLMEALARMGDRPAALAQFETCAAVLAEELGISPSPGNTRPACCHSRRDPAGH